MNSITYNIDSNNYILSLINYSYKNDIINEIEFNNIISKLLDLLYYKCNHYNSNLINTISADTLKSINISNMFVLGLYLKRYNNNYSINKLLNDNIYSLYNESYNYINSFINKVKLFYKVIFYKNIIKINNYYYNSTLIDGIEAFFKHYNSSYFAYDIVITFDYECALERLNLNGIEFLYKYLEYINYENIYCSKFNYKSIDLLLKTKYINYENIVINIFSDVFLISLLLRYLNKDIYSLDTSLIDTNIIYNDFKNNIFESKLFNSFISIKDEFKLNSNTNNYLDMYYYKVYKTIIYFINNKRLEFLVGECDSIIV